MKDYCAHAPTSNKIFPLFCHPLASGNIPLCYPPIWNPPMSLNSPPTPPPDAFAVKENWLPCILLTGFYGDELAGELRGEQGLCFGSRVVVIWFILVKLLVTVITSSYPLDGIRIVFIGLFNKVYWDWFCLQFDRFNKIQRILTTSVFFLSFLNSPKSRKYATDR